jgi:hypothetical protein
MSTTSFYRFFRENRHDAEFVIREKIKCAKVIENPAIQINEVCHLSGFTVITSFVCLKSTEGITPKQYQLLYV